MNYILDTLWESYCKKIAADILADTTKIILCLKQCFTSNGQNNLSCVIVSMKAGSLANITLIQNNSISPHIF